MNLFTIQTIDNKFLLIKENNHDNNDSRIIFKNVAEQSTFYNMRMKGNYDFSIIGSNGNYLYAITTYPEAFNGSIVEINYHDLAHWETIVPNQKMFMLKDAIYADKKFIAVFQHEFQQCIAIYTDSGERIKQINRLDGSNTKLVGYSPEEKSFILSENFFFCPPIGEILSTKNDSLSYIAKTLVNYDPLKYKWEIKDYKSADGTLIPIYILYNKKYINKGPRPTLLEFYGGFGITPEPQFDPGLVIFLNSGGTFAFANVRGGANSVKGWHQMGSLMNKHNTFDDVYSAAKFLIDSSYSDPSKIALTGGSNGGLVGAAVVNAHPGYFRAALLTVGVYDMLRAEKYTIGAYNTTNEFGSVTQPMHFKNLLSYSPIHNIKANTQYPSMLIMTSEYDDRVPPLHSYKYVAALQELTKSKNPILLQIEKNEGHSLQSFEKLITRSRYFYSFLFKEMEMKYHAY